MPDFNSHNEILDLLTEAQDADQDRRDAAREAHAFVDHRSGQWEPDVYSANENQPRYTFDKTSPVVDQICGEIDQADFDIKVSPAGGDSTKEDAKLYDGLIRNIEYVSDASTTYELAARNMVTAGLDGWMVVQKYADADSFDQDLHIQKISNFIDSVFFGPFKEPDARDAKFCFVLEAISKKEYDEKYPDGSGHSVSDGRQTETYLHKRDQIVIGNIFYVVERPRELALLKSGRVIDITENRMILDELAAEGDTIKATRKRNKHVVKSRLFDGRGWLNEAQDTVFNTIPVVPCIANFKVFENKLIYRGVVEKLLDPQRVFNYTKSRQVSETALSPRAKYWMTRKQAAGNENELATLNTNADPVQFFNYDPDNPGPPQQIGGAMVNPGLAQLSADMREVMQEVANMFAPSFGDNPGLQSGVAIQKLQDKGDTGTVKYFRAMERAIARTARILVSAIPRVYDQHRQVRILNEDGSFDITEINQTVVDRQTGQIVTVNDLSKGQYDVVCSSGPSFNSRRAETVAAITEVGAVDPTAIQMGSDILFNNLDSPGMDLLAERKRLQLFNAGVIPESQMTDEEKQQMALIRSQPPAPDPNMVLAQAEAGKAEAQANKVLVDANIAQSKEARENAKAQMMQDKQIFEQMLNMQKEQREAQKQIIESQETLAHTLKLLRESMGIGTIITPDSMAAYHKAAQNSQDIM